ncbi:MAG: endonuclease/exonuclease/phosphatase family protein [Candidatus Binataceae bacterium]
MTRTARTENNIRLTLLTWNLHGLPWPITKDLTGRIDRVAAKIRELSPEIAMLQEAWRAAETERLVRALQPEWTPFFASGRMNRPRGGLLGFARTGSGWRLTRPPDFHAFASSAPAWKFWEGDGLSGKGALVLNFERGGDRFTVVNTHMQSPYPGIDYAAVRESQLAELGGIVANLDRAAPVIVAGDFNTDPREPLYSAIAALGTDLTVDLRERSGCGTIFDWRDGRQEWIDYLVAANSPAWAASGELELIRNRGRDDPYSDHNGLFAKIAITPR